MYGENNTALLVPGVSGGAEGVDDDEGEDELHAELAARQFALARPVRVGHQADHGVVGLVLQAGRGGAHSLFKDRGRAE